MNSLTLAAGAHAFGDGTHPTTRGVLEALAMMDPAEFIPRIACDMGAGSGIISFAMMEKFGCPVVAVDVESSAVATLRQNAARNGVDGLFPLHTDGFDHPEIAMRGPYDCIVMNILAEPLMRLADAACSHLAPDGVMVLSGILQWQEPQIAQAYAGLGLMLSARLVVGDWVTLVWQKTPH